VLSRRAPKTSTTEKDADKETESLSVAGKKEIRRNSKGFERFEDYFSEEEDGDDSVDQSAKETETDAETPKKAGDKKSAEAKKKAEAKEVSHSILVQILLCVIASLVIIILRQWSLIFASLVFNLSYLTSGSLAILPDIL